MKCGSIIGMIEGNVCFLHARTLLNDSSSKVPVKMKITLYHEKHSTHFKVLLLVKLLNKFYLENHYPSLPLQVLIAIQSVHSTYTIIFIKRRNLSETLRALCSQPMYC